MLNIYKTILPGIIMDNKKYAYNIISKIKAENFNTGRLLYNSSSTIYDHNDSTSSYVYWRNDYYEDTSEVILSNNIKVIRLKQSTSRLYSNNVFSNIKSTNFQVEFEILIPAINALNVYFTFFTSSSQRLYFAVTTNSFIINCNNKSIKSGFKFKNNTKYILLATKENNIYSFMVDGIYIGYIESPDFTNNINLSNGSAGIIANVHTYDSAFASTLMDIYNINISDGQYLKYYDQYSKYGKNLVSYFNIDTLALTSDSNNIITNLEAIPNTQSWEYSDLQTNKSNITNTVFTYNINTNFTLLFNKNNDYKTMNSIELININNNYRVLYTSLYIPPDLSRKPKYPLVINENTTTALDFENSLIDNVETGLWQKSGTADISNVNVIFNKNSLEIKNIGDSLYTTNSVISGMTTPFTIDFYFVVNNFYASIPNAPSDMVIQYPLISQSNSAAYGEQAVYINKDTKNIEYYRNQSFSSQIPRTGGKNKVRLNEINHLTISFDGAATRFFLNDELDFVIGDIYGWMPTMNEFRFMDILVPSFPQYRTYTSGLIDNINIHDGIATKVRAHDLYANNLLIDLAFDGGNNSSTIVDNGLLSTQWYTQGTAKISTQEKFDGVSSLFISNGAVYTASLITLPSKFTISFDTLITANFTDWGRFAQFTSSDNKNSLVIRGTKDTNTFAIHYLDPILNEDTYLFNNVAIPLNLPTNIKLVRNNDLYSLYLNNTLYGTISSDVIYPPTTINIGSSKTFVEYLTNTYIKNFKIYDINITPPIDSAKIELNFNNNLNDHYKSAVATIEGTIGYDNIKSFKGHALNINGGQNRVNINNNNLNFESKDFILSYDISLSNIDSGARYAITNNIPYHSSGSIWLAASTYLGLDYYDKPLAASPINTLHIAKDTFYNVFLFRKNKNIHIKYNNVLVGSHNLNNHVFNFIGGNNMSIGRSSNFATGDSFIGYMDNFKSQKDTPILISDDGNGTEGVWIQSVADCNSSSMLKYDFNNITLPTYNEYYKNTKSFAALFYHRGNPAIVPNLTTPIIINKSILNTKFNITAQNGCWSNSEIYVTIEILDSNNNVIAALKWQWVNTYSHFMYYGANLSSLTQTSYVGQYPGTFGDIYFKDDRIEYTHNSAYAHNNSSFIFNVDLRDAKSLRVANLKSYEDYSSCAAYFVFTKVSNKVYKSVIEVEDEIDQPAIYLPLENSADNLGYTKTDAIINGNMLPSIINDKKYFTFNNSGSRYITIAQSNIFELSYSLDYYIEFDFILTQFEATSHIMMINNFTHYNNQGGFYISISPGNDTTEHANKVVFHIFDNGKDNQIRSKNSPYLNKNNNLKIIRKNGIVTLILNDIEDNNFLTSNFAKISQESFSLAKLNLSTNSFAIGYYNHYTTTVATYYISGFKFWPGVSKPKDNYNYKEVMDIDFSPTGKSYLFKDNYNKCIIHPHNITHREYKNSKYGCSFNGLDKILKIDRNNLLNLGYDDFVMSINLEITNFNNMYARFISDAATSSDTTYIMVTGDGYTAQHANKICVAIADGGPNQYFFSTQKLVNNTIYNIKLVRNNNNFTLYINDEIDATYASAYPFNLIRNGLTTIGGNNTLSQNQMFNGIIYSIKIIRNTSDIEMLNEKVIPPVQHAKYVLTNGVDEQELNYDNTTMDCTIKFIKDENDITLFVDDDSITVPKNDTILGNNIKLFTNYTGHIKNYIKLYNTPIYDNDYVESDFIDTAIPPLYIDDNNLMGSDINIGDDSITGYIEGHPNRKYQIIYKPLNVIIEEGIGVYDYFGIDSRYIDEYEIYDIEANKRYTPPHMGPRGYLTTYINSQVCNASDFAIRLYKRDSGVFIGEYELDKTRDPYECTVHNLDTTKTYDIMLFDKNNNIESRVMSNRSPEAY